MIVDLQESLLAKHKIALVGFISDNAQYNYAAFHQVVRDKLHKGMEPMLHSPCFVHTLIQNPTRSSQCMDL